MRKSPPQRRTAQRGFTLIETIVALTMGAIILSAAMSVAANVASMQQRDRARAVLMTEGIFIQQAIEQTIAFAGIGTSDRGHIVDGLQIYSSVLVARPNALGVLGDFPRPHTQYNTFGYLHPQSGGDPRHIAFHNENNGTCMPTTCNPGDTSVFFSGDAGTCNSIGDRLCPWGLKRLESGDRFMIASGAGDYTTADFANGGVQAVGGTTYVRLTSNWDDLGSPNEQWLGTATDPPYTVPGIGFVTTLDRVFLRRQGNTFERIQCWGDPVPDAAGWPDETDNTLPSRAQMQGVTSPYDGSTSTCTRWEKLSTHVQSVLFTYFEQDPSVSVDATVAGGKAAIRRIDYTVVLRSTFSDGTFVEFPVVGSMAINNLS